MERKDVKENVTVLQEITPHHKRCIPGTCPGVYEASDGELLIIGKKLSAQLALEMQHKVAPDEYVIKISKEYFRGIDF